MDTINTTKNNIESSEQTATVDKSSSEDKYSVMTYVDTPLLKREAAPGEDGGQSDASDLHDAAMRGDVAACECFLRGDEGGLDLNMRKGKFLWTPLHLAVKYEHYEVAHLLVKRKAILGIRDVNEKTALEWVEHKIFLRNNGVLKERNSKTNLAGKTALDAIHILLTDSVEMGTALYEAARSGGLAVLELLAEYPGIGIEAEGEALKRAAFFADVEALKCLMGCVHDRGAMLAIKYPLIPTAADTAMEPAVSSDKLPMCQLIAGALLDIACLNRGSIEREADKAPLEFINLEVEMMGEGKLRSYKPFRLRVLKHASVAECLIKAVLFKSINEEWRTLLDRHQLTLDMDKQCAPMDVTKRIDEYGLKDGDALLFVPSDPTQKGTHSAIMTLSAAKRNLMLATSLEECVAAHKQVGATPLAQQLPIEMGMVMKRIDSLQMREEQKRSCVCSVQ